MAHQLRHSEPLNYDSIRDRLFSCGRIGCDEAARIIQEATRILKEEPNLLNIKSSTLVVGDLHGQLYDLAKVLGLASPLDKSQVLFLGNYIGGGGFNTESVLLILLVKVCFPSTVFLLRGSNESRYMAEVFKLETDFKSKYSEAIFLQVMEVFNCLPLAALVSEKYFCVHGGLSPELLHVGDINYIQRFRDIPSRGAMCDLVWSDPFWDVENPFSGEDFGSAPSEYYRPERGSYEVAPAFHDKEDGGRGYLFNFASVKHFAVVNHLLCVIRSHEVQDEGYRLYRALPSSDFPSVISIFSAPSCCGSHENNGAVIRIAGASLDITKLCSTPHPLSLLHLNAISWSLRFALENLHCMLGGILGEELPI